MPNGLWGRCAMALPILGEGGDRAGIKQTQSGCSDAFGCIALEQTDAVTSGNRAEPMRDKGPVRGTSRELMSAARRLRTEATPAETVLWDALRDRRLAGLKFRRRHAVGSFVLDFYCPEQKLAIEVAGSAHEDVNHQLRDAARTERLQTAGYRVLRVSNADVLGSLDVVLAAVLAACEADRILMLPCRPSQSWERQAIDQG
jgi:very-short-patch-repair endonuclease